MTIFSIVFYEIDFVLFTVLIVSLKMCFKPTGLNVCASLIRRHFLFFRLHVPFLRPAAGRM